MRLVISLILVEVASGLLLYLLRHARRTWHQGQLLELDVTENASFDPKAWIGFFRNLYGMTPPGWKRALFGLPHMTFEFRLEQGEVSAYAWCPERLQNLLRVHLQTASPGLQVRASEVAPAAFGRRAARARLVLWRDSVHPLAEPRDDSLRGVLVALADAPRAVMQVAISPEVGWQGRALRLYDQAHDGHRRSGAGGAVVGELAGLLREVASIFVPPTSYGPASQAPPARPSMKLELPPPDKALRPGYGVEVRLRIEGSTTGEAKRHMHALGSAFRACDGANGLRPAPVWRGAVFDRSIAERRPPR